MLTALCLFVYLVATATLSLKRFNQYLTVLKSLSTSKKTDQNQQSTPIESDQHTPVVKEHT